MVQGKRKYSHLFRDRKVKGRQRLSSSSGYCVNFDEQKEAVNRVLSQFKQVVLYSGKVYYLQVLSYKESNPIMFGWI